MSDLTDPHQTIAIVGMAALMPGAPDLDAYWRNLVDGVDAITDVPAHRWDEEFYDPDEAHRPDRMYCRRGGFVDDHASFEPLRFGIMPTSIGDIEPDQLITLQVAAAAIDDAGGQDRLPDRDRIGVLLGRGGILSPAQARYAQRVRMSSQVIGILKELIPELPPESLDRVRRKFDERLGPQQPEGTIGLVPNLAASRVANRLNLRGPSYTIDAACASSLIAVDQGMTELRAGRLDAVLAGGVHHVHDISFWSVFSQLRALSRQGEIRPFDSSADGLLIGEGTGIVVLKRLADALDAGDRVYAVISGSGVSSDGRSASMFNPASSGQSLAIRRAWQSAGLDPTAPDALGLLEAHGTGTPTGDAAELVTVAEVFGGYQGGPRPVIGSVKSMIGHTMPAAGIAGLIKATLAVHRGVLPPTLHCGQPREEMAATRFAPIAAAQPWESDGPRRAGVNAFGFGGINAHVIIEQPPSAPSAWAAVPNGAAGQSARSASVEVEEPDQVLWLAADDPAGLAALLDRDDSLVRREGTAFADGPHAHAAPPCRIGVVDPTDKRLATARRAVSRGEPWRGARDIWFTTAPLLTAGGKLAFVFPGLEAEFTPRTRDLAAHFGLVDREWSAADLGRHGAGLIEVGKFLDEVLGRIGIRPDAVAGHSIGEWSAAAVSGQVSTTDMDGFLKLFDADSVAVSGYVFAAVGAGADQVTPALGGYPGVVLSHDNAPAQSVVNGPEEQVDRLVDELRRRNVLCQKLPFRSAFHTPAFADGLRSIGVALQSWRVHPTTVPVWSATLAAPFPTDEQQVNQIFVRHMMEPVWFRQLTAAMYDAGFRVFLQVGAGQLASLVSDNLRGRDHLAMPVNVGHRTGLDQLRRVATALWVEGAAPDLRALRSPAAAAPAPAAPAAPPRRGPKIQLDLGGPLVRLGPGADTLLGLADLSSHRPSGTPVAEAQPSAAAAAQDTSAPPAEPRPPAAPRPPAGPRPPAHAESSAESEQSAAAQQSAVTEPPANSLTALHRLAGRSKAAAELAALLRDTADGAVTVLDAATRPASPAPVSPAAPARPVAAPPADVRPVTVPAVVGPTTAAPTPKAVPPPRTEIARTTLRVSVQTMPYLLDHCFFVQPDDWPNPEDRWPVVPATTVVQHMMDAVAQAVPGLRVVGVRDARFNRWTIAAPAQDVEIVVRSAGPDSYAVNFGSFARATVDVAADYPAPVSAPWTHDPATETAPRISAEEMYAERLMFHGPQFHGVTTVHALGEMHVRGVVTAPVPPGALLDNALQLIGNWLITTQPMRTVALPVGLGHVRFFGPPPAPGTAFECVARVRSIDDAQLVADTQLSVDGRVWAQIDGAVDRRFDSHPQARPAERFPERHPMSVRQPEGWTAVFDCWTDLVTQSMAARGILGTAASVDYERQPGKTRKQWLLGRIAAKDAVRFRQWDAGHTDVYPIELTIANDPNGRPRADLRPDRDLRECDLSLAHCAEAAVAIAGPARSTPDGPGVGIDIVEVTDRPDSTVDYALSGAEAALLDQVSAGGDRRFWFACFWAAKEAAGKAEGTGLDGAPRRLRVVAVDAGTLLVEVPSGRSYRVTCRSLENPPDLPQRRYVVGWTWGPEPAR
ncbi:beta-ketoacyl synthase N-terminal-like domain-containing protein [Solwaraspora sp. WMMA2080]|uniref:type I polyketide synthase n=1 Tax=unclassified Solwaraspora TaxID=2627926 RepID=UPI00248B7E4D|nr:MULTISPECIES: type I polyketide synthase [unclassified Solwaraspora]WBC00004.1 beta-ketoacyl synthase N-terminal-like domain-containing protein [Solwaraspora sp. WMMA2059]WBC21450.1 beta-ketoacyl synthase N-terminal-like domain-containing protein [Solwaraspora sp. WMMA2080]